MRNAVHGLYKKAAEVVLPPLSKSQFEEKRVLTPQEFVISGDFLVRTCPTWSWESGDANKSKSYLPKEKQYLVTRNVPCLSRATDLEQYDPASEFALGGDEDGWVATHKNPAADRQPGQPDDEIPSIEDEVAGAAAGGKTSAAAATAATDDEDIPDMGDLDLEEPADEAAVPVAAPSQAGGASGPTSKATGGSSSSSRLIKRTRTYDLYITYDQYYQVPRLWLVGFDEAKQPLTPQQVLQDVSEEHARKTITLDPHPHPPSQPSRCTLSRNCQ